MTYEIILRTFMQLCVGLGIVGACVLAWCVTYDWFTDNRKLTDAEPQAFHSWARQDSFFNTITEFQDDFSSK